MVRRGRRRHQGLASIMDAFMFMLAIIALSSFLIGVGNDGQEGFERDASQEHVDRSHTVLLSMTLALPEAHGENDSPAVEVASLIQPKGNGETLTLPDWAIEPVEQMIGELLGSGWGFEWQAEFCGTKSTLAAIGAPSQNHEIFASSVECPGRGDLALRLVLRAWRAWI